jgi:MoxR-like ATPase
LLNRWIVPLENQVDYLTLRTGQQIQVPFRQMLVISTNIDPVKVITPALLRRMGYRLYLGYPSEDHYAETFRRYAAGRQLDVPPGLIEKLLARYQAERRPLRSCEPRDLIERARDICNYRQEPVRLSEEVMDVAWVGYFGNQPDTEQ